MGLVIGDVRLNSSDGQMGALHSMVARECLCFVLEGLGLCSLEIRSCTVLTFGDDRVVTEDMLNRLVATKLVYLLRKSN